MGNGKGLGGLIALIGLAFLFSKRRNGIQPVGWHRELIERRVEVYGMLPHEANIEREGFIMPTFPTVPTAVTPLDPTRVDYEEALEAKYPAELKATRRAYRKTRKVLGLREYVAPPMPRYTRARRGR